MMGLVLLLAALGVSVVLVVVFMGLVRAKMAEREDLLRDGGADEQELVEARKHRPAIKGWMTCSAVVLVVLTALGTLWFKGCQLMGEAWEQSNHLEVCRESVAAQADWLGQYWDQHKKLPKPEEAPVSAIDCPAGNQFRYVGHRKIQLGGRRLLIIEIDPHRNGTRRALVVGEDFLKKRQTVAKATGTPTGATPGGWGPWSPYRQVFTTRAVSESEYEDIREQVERLEDFEE
jgi:hypothetical protein